MAKTRQDLPKTKHVDRVLLDVARQLGNPENFFVGLPDAALPPPQNVLMFCQRRLNPATQVSHHRYLLIFSLETEVTMLLDGLVVRLSPGQALLVFPFQSHRYMVQEIDRLTWLFMTFELSETRALDSMRNRPVDVPLEIRTLLVRLIEEYRRVWLGGEPSGEVPVLLSYILQRLQRQCREEGIGTEWEPHLALSSHRIVQRAGQFVMAHMLEPFSAVDIATAVSVSPGHLRSCFRRVLGMRVMAYVRRTRACAACSLLSRTESNVTEIARLCGFRSVYSFSRAFKQEIGMAPTAYRRHLWEGRNMLESSQPERSWFRDGQ